MEHDFFTDRLDAGRKLASKLKLYSNHPDVVILALPRGGVVIGFEIAQSLKAPLDIVVTRKIGHPQNSEFAIGAITEDGELIGNREMLASVDQQWLTDEIEKQKTEAHRRRNLYLDNKRLINLHNKIVILVDDGIATGLTMLAAIKQVRRANPGKIVVAVPVCPPDVAEQLEREANELVVYTIPSFFLGAISGYYENFSQVTDEQVIRLLRK